MSIPFVAPFLARLKALPALPIRTVTWGLVVVFSSWIVLDLTYLKVSSGLSQTTYDAMVKNRFYAAPPDPRVVIVDIDEASLARMGKEFGRWPWPRDTLASVQGFIEREAPLAIVWDIAFSDADRLSPGGDAALNESAKHSPHSHYSVIRLPAVNDAKSELTRAHLPTLWVDRVGSADGALVSSATLAVIVPVLPSLAAGKLGFNNGYPDPDGVLRRYRYFEVLPDGSTIQSTPLSVVRDVSPSLAARALVVPQNFDKNGVDTGTLIAWRKEAEAYPKVSFADVFERAEGGAATPVHAGQNASTVPSFKGKVVIVGSTAPSLHDIHPTPLASFQAGVESLATVIDNGINARFIAEVPRWLQALMAMGLCVGLAVWVRRFGIASLDGALVILPGALLGISYLSLNLLPVFLDLQLAAGAVLLFLAALRMWNNARRNYWCGLPSSLSPNAKSGLDADKKTMTGVACGLILLNNSAHLPFADTGLDHLIDWLEAEAPHCRVVGGDASSQWPAKLRWAELASVVGVVGSLADLMRLQKCERLPAGLAPNGSGAGQIQASRIVPFEGTALHALTHRQIADTFTAHFFRSEP